MDTPNRAERVVACFSLVAAVSAGAIAVGPAVDVESFPESQNLALIPKRSPVPNAPELELDDIFDSQIPKNRQARRAQRFGHVAKTFSHRI